VPPPEFLGEMKALPAELRDVLAFARAQGCDWIMFDRDGDPHGRTPTKFQGIRLGQRVIDE